MTHGGSGTTPRGVTSWDALGSACEEAGESSRMEALVEEDVDGPRSQRFL